MHRVYSGSAQRFNLCHFEGTANRLLLGGSGILFHASNGQVGGEPALFRFITQALGGGLNPTLERLQHRRGLDSDIEHARALQAWERAESTQVKFKTVK